MEGQQEGRDELGRFTKGNKFKPPHAHRRKKPNYISELETWIQNEFSPEVVVAGMRDLWLNGNEKTRLKVLEIILDRTLGKPVTRQISANLDIEKFRELFMDDGAGDDSQIVDGEVIDEDTV